MKAQTFNRLVENLKHDRVLTQLPLVHKGEVLSGNHRVKAALKAGITESDVLELVGDVAPGRRVAIQLSHNSIAGEDDPNLLRDLYEALDFDEKCYSGITDEMLGVDPLDLNALSAGPLEEVEITATFLPEDAEVFLRFVEAAGKGSLGILDGGMTLSKGKLEELGHSMMSLPSNTKGATLAKSMKEAVMAHLGFCPCCRSSLILEICIR